MTKSSFTAVYPLSACVAAGTCDMQLEGATVRFSKVSLEDTEGPRSFRIDYRGATALCAGPTLAEGGKEAIPFGCAITSTTPDTGPLQVELRPGCTTGVATKKEANAPPRRWELKTDVLTIDGRRSPKREVSILDERGVLATVDSLSSYAMDLYVRPGATLTPVQTLALIAARSYIEAPAPQCMVPERA